MIRAFMRHNSLLLLATVVTTPLSLLYSILTARVLGPEAFGILGVVLALYQVLAQTIGPFSLVTAKYVAEYHAVGNRPATAALLRRIMRLLVWVGVVSLLAIGAISPLIRSFLHLDSSRTVILVSLLFAASLGMEMARGVLQGLHAFGQLALNQIAEALARLIVGIGLLAVGLTVDGAIVAYILGVIGAIVLVAPRLRAMTRDPGPRPALGPILAYTRAVTLMGVSNIVLANASIILVKHYFSAYDAGIFAAVVSFGRILYLVATVFLTTMFPSLAALRATNQSSVRLIALNLTVLTAISVCAIAVLAVLGNALVRIVYGDAYLPAAPLLALYGLSIVIALPIGMVNVYLLASARLALLFTYAGGAALQIALLLLVHRTLPQVILMVCASNLVMLGAYGFLLRGSLRAIAAGLLRHAARRA